MSSGARIGLVVGCLLIVGAAVALGLWAYRSNYQILFADMAVRDAAAMTAELDKMKVPYQLAEGGNTILVPKDLVYKTRLTLMGKDLPLQGAVGFEVFNNADFGMTEFVQKVNYQRAIQGELTRTILSIDGIAAARVHLAIPEQGLFKKSVTRPKASVTVTLKPGKQLAPEQVTGIQRLVAASVPELTLGEVTVLDQHGVALTRLAGTDPGVESASTQLDSKRSTEDYLVKKVAKVLDQTFGEGNAIASVDVLLNMDQSKVTTEEVLPAKGAQTGVTVRERYSSRDPDASVGTGAIKGAGADARLTGETDYQVGRRVEQLAVASGTVKRMTVAVLVKRSLDDAQIDKMKEVVALAIGLNSQRGDAIVVYPMDRFGSADQTAAVVLPTTVESTVIPAPVQAAALSNRVIWILLGVILLALAALCAWLWRAGRREPQTDLDDAARARLLADVRAWIAVPEPLESPLAKGDKA